MYFFASSLPAVTALGISLWLGHWCKQEFEEQQRPFYPLIMMGLLILLGVFCLLRESVIFGTFITTTSNMHTKMC